MSIHILLMSIFASVVAHSTSPKYVLTHHQMVCQGVLGQLDLLLLDDSL